MVFSEKLCDMQIIKERKGVMKVHVTMIRSERVTVRAHVSACDVSDCVDITGRQLIEKLSRRTID